MQCGTTGAGVAGVGRRAGGDGHGDRRRHTRAGGLAVRGGAVAPRAHRCGGATAIQRETRREGTEEDTEGDKERGDRGRYRARQERRPERVTCWLGLKLPRGAPRSTQCYSGEKVANRDVRDFGRSLKRPFRDVRRFPSTRWNPVPEATRATLGFGIRPSFKGQFLSRRAKP
jgi:hypothetical protein